MLCKLVEGQGIGLCGQFNVIYPGLFSTVENVRKIFHFLQGRILGSKFPLYCERIHPACI